MELTSRPSISTNYLTQAFGWDSSHRSNQSDIHELQTILLDSLNLPELITKLYEFKVDDNLEFMCECGEVNKRSKEMTVTDLQFSIKGTFEESLKDWESLEVLSGDNGVECEKCKKKNDAKKYQCISELPQILNLCLRRLEFDIQMMRRVRVSSSFSIPPIINLKTGLSTLQTGERVSYNLRSVMVHSGTANGGHYYCFNKLEGGWVKCNDSITTSLTDEEMEKMMEGLGGMVYMMVFVKVSGEQGDTEKQRWSIMSYSYVSNTARFARRSFRSLLVRSPARNPPQEGFEKKTKVPEDLQKIVQHSENTYLQMKEIWNQKKDIVSLNIHWGPEEEKLDVKKTETLHALTSYLCDKHKILPHNARIRRFNLNKPGETFTSKESSTLSTLNITSSLNELLFETKTDSEMFEDFLVDDLIINLLIIDCDKKEQSASNFKLLSNPPMTKEEGITYIQAERFRKSSTVSTIFEILKEKNLTISPSIFYIDCDELKDLSFPILMDTRLSSCDLHLGSVIVYDNLKVKSIEIVKMFERFKNIIRITFNVPDLENDLENGNHKTVDIDKSLNVEDLIKSITENFNIEDKIYLRRAKSGQQIITWKTLGGDKLMSLKKAGLIRDSTVYVERGVGLQDNEYETTFFNRSKPNEPVLTCNINGDDTVDDIRKLIHEKLTSPPVEYTYLRLHDKPTNFLLRSDSKFSETSQKKGDVNRQILLTHLTFSEDIPTTATVVSVKFLLQNSKPGNKYKVINSGTILPYNVSGRVEEVILTCKKKWGEKLGVSKNWSLGRNFKGGCKNWDKVKWWVEGEMEGGVGLRDNDVMLLRVIDRVVDGGSEEGEEEVVEDKSKVEVEEKDNERNKSAWRGNVALTMRKERGIVIKKYGEVEGLRTESA